MAIGLGATSIAVVAATWWLHWWKLLALYALFNFVLTNGILVFVIVSQAVPLVVQ